MKSSESILALSVVVVVALAGWSCDTVLPKRTEGEKLYRKHCADCHGVDASGNTIGYMGNDAADLLDESWKYGTGPESIHYILRDESVFRHPSYIDLSNQEIREITKHVVHLRRQAY